MASVTPTKVNNERWGRQMVQTGDVVANDGDTFTVPFTAKWAQITDQNSGVAAAGASVSSQTVTVEGTNGHTFSYIVGGVA